MLSSSLVDQDIRNDLDGCQRIEATIAEISRRGVLGDSATRYGRWIAVRLPPAVASDLARARALPQALTSVSPTIANLKLPFMDTPLWPDPFDASHAVRMRRADSPAIATRSEERRVGKECR